MDRTVYTSLGLLAASISLWASSQAYSSPLLTKGFHSALTVFILYTLFRVVLNKKILEAVEKSDIRYRLRKTLSFVYYALILIALFTVWVENKQALVVAYGLVAAGIAISLQDVVKNTAGGIMLLFNGLYGVGDRIEIDGICGDVIDVSLLYTTLLETRGWVDGDQATGRLTIIPNGGVLIKAVYNYTKDHNYLWDEITVPVTYDSDWKKAAETFLGIIRKETEEVTKAAAKELKKLEGKYYLTKRSMEPETYIKLTDNWITVTVRYVTEARSRRLLSNRINRLILEAIEAGGDIKVASSTIDVTLKKK